METTSEKKGMSTITLIGLAIVLALIAGLLLSLSNIAKQQHMYLISTFSECKEAGYPIMESFPEQCITPDGRTFVNEDQSNEPTSSTTPIQPNGCSVGGCSGQLCVSAADADGAISTCEYRAEYACYQHAVCEPQADGKCGWTQTSELRQCLSNPPALNAQTEIN